MTLLAFVSHNTTNAAVVTEDFENVTITETDSWGFGKALSNGWKILGGSIYSSAGVTNYGLWNKANSGSVALEASYSSTNNALVVIPTQLTGTIKFYARKTSSSSSVKGYVDLWEVEPDGDTFKKVGSSSFKYWTLTSTTYSEYSVDLGSEPRYIAICLSRAAIDDVTFDTFETSAGPRLTVLCEGKSVKNGGSHAFGLVSEPASVDYIIKNTGTAPLAATVSCTGAFTTSLTSLSLDADAEQTITITQSAETFGTQNGTLTIAPEGLDPFTINLSGIVRDPSKVYVDFSETPTGWTIDSENWSIADGYAKIGYYYSTYGNGLIQSPTLTISEGDELYLRYSKNTQSTYSSAYFTILTSEDGNTWTQFGERLGADAVYGELSETTISGIPSSVHFIAISGQYMAIDDIYGFSLSTLPVLSLTCPGAERVGNEFTDHFGFVKSDCTHTYTVSNAGMGELVLNIGTSSEQFTLSDTNITLSAGEEATISVTYLFDGENFDSHSAIITLTPDCEGVEGASIHVSAISEHPDTFSEDFENGIPDLWNNSGWETKSQPTGGNGSRMAYSGLRATNTLTTPLLTAAEGEEIEVQVLLPWTDETLTMEYSTDEGKTWNVAYSETPSVANTLKTIRWAAPADGTYLLRFSGSYNYIDNIHGFRYAPTVFAASEYAIRSQWATLCYPADVQLPEGVQAFTASSISGGYVYLEEVEGIVPAYEPVLLFSADCQSVSLPEAEYINKRNAPIMGSEGNHFKGCLSSIILRHNTQYVLQQQDEILAFYRVNPSKPITTEPLRSYLEVPQAADSKLFIHYEEPELTSIVRPQSESRKASVRDLNGRPVQRLQRGVIYIVGGQKVIVK